MSKLELQVKGTDFIYLTTYIIEDKYVDFSSTFEVEVFIGTANENDVVVVIVYYSTLVWL